MWNGYVSFIKQDYKGTDRIHGITMNLNYVIFLPMHVILRELYPLTYCFKSHNKNVILPSQLYNSKISVNKVRCFFVNRTEFCTFVAKFKNSILNYK